MLFSWRSLGLCAIASAALLASNLAEAAMQPVPAGQDQRPDVQLAWCAVGAHIGPVGACIGGSGYRRGYYHHCWINRWGRRVCN